MDKIRLGCGTEILLSALDAAKISYVPCGTVDGKDQPLLKYAHLHGKRQHVTRETYGKKWNAHTTSDMTGVQLMCGKPTYKRHGRTGYLYYNSIDIEARLGTEYPEVAAQITTVYREACEGAPCEIQTKSGGLRLDAYTPYSGKKWAFSDAGGMLLEVLADKCLARIDHRYQMLSGSLLEMPTLPKEALQEIHGIISEVATTESADENPREVVETSQIGDLAIEWGSHGRSQLFPTEHCQRTNHSSNREEVRFTKHSDGSSDGKCFNCGETWWEIPPKQQRSRRPVKLQKNIVSVLTETIDASRAFLQSVFEDKKIKFFGLRADTGVGKTEGMITSLLRGVSGLVNVPTMELAIEVEARLNAAEVAGVFRYRGILSNPDGEFPDENPCIHAVRYDAIASRGWNAYQLLCEHCEVREICEVRGYRSQAERAKQAQVSVMPFPDLFRNPAFRTLAKDYLPTYHDDLILHDEFDPYNAFLEINVPKSRLVQMRDDWEGYAPSEFAKEVLRLLEVEGDLSLLRPLVMGNLTEKERGSILEGLTSVLWNGQVLSREDAHRCLDFVRASRSLDTIGNLPRLETETWNLLVQFELFFERYTRDADMPMKYENDTLTFYLPPLPMKTRARMGFMSATLDETLFRRAMDNRQAKRGDVTFHDTGLTAWHPEAKVYQLRTNRNPRATAYTPKGERVEGELLSTSGNFYWGLVAADLEKPNRGLITYKALLEEKASELDGIVTANFGGLVGLDTHFKDVDVLHVLFSPEVPPSAVELKAKMLFGNDTEPLCYERDAEGQYQDERLQQCYADGVKAELQQAIGRGRLVSKPIKVIVWCSHSLPGITDREQTLLFDEVDWQQAQGDIEKLQEIIALRDDGDVQALAEATGQSERTAYRQTQTAKKQTKAEMKQQAIVLHDEGKSYREIGKILGKAPNTIKNWVCKN
ncbi:MAG: helix-turn-helix domain-containing protein [Flavobacteriales bacterium]